MNFHGPITSLGIINKITFNIIKNYFVNSNLISPITRPKSYFSTIFLFYVYMKYLVYSLFYHIVLLF